MKKTIFLLLVLTGTSLLSSCGYYGCCSNTSSYSTYNSSCGQGSGGGNWY